MKNFCYNSMKPHVAGADLLKAYCLLVGIVVTG
jgi:hypothetical protein